MDLHRLKVVKFDGNFEKKSYPKEVIGDVAKHTTCAIINEREIKRSEHNNFTGNNKIPTIKRPFNIHKSKSEPLKVIPKEKSFRKHARRKTISFDELKKNFTYKHNLFKPMRLSKLMHRKKITERNKEIKVLFANEVPRLTKYYRNVKHRNTKVGTFTEKSNASYDIFGFQNRKCSFDLSSKQYRCDKGCITKKISKLQSTLNKINELSQPKDKPKSVAQRQPLKFLKSQASKLRVKKSDSNSCACITARHYNLVCFPENNNSTWRGKNTVSSKTIPVYPSAYFRDCTCKDQQVSVTPSRLQVRKKAVGDAAVATSCSLCDNCIKPTHVKASSASRAFCCVNKTPKSTRRSRILCHNFGTTNKIFPNESLKKYEHMTRTVVKCILLVLVIIAWIPCIITVPLCWILTYPVRPQFIKTSGCENEECPHKRTPLYQIMNAVKCLADKAVYSIKTILSLLRSHNKEDFLQHRPNTCSGGCPDPNKKYTLFYTDHRGWRMKSIRGQNLGMHDGDHQAFRDQNLKTAQDVTKHNIRVKRKCCGCKLRKVEKNTNIDTTLYHKTKYKNQSQNTKCRKNLHGRSQILNGEANSLEHKINRPRIRSKSHPLPYNSHENSPNKCVPCLRNSLSSPVSLNNSTATRKRKTIFTCHHLPNCCGSCEQQKQHKMTSKSTKKMNDTYYKTIKKYHTCRRAKEKKKDKSYFKRLWYYMRSSFNRLERIIDETEDEVWKDDIQCYTYLDTLQDKPCPWLYRRCPSVYPCILVWLKCIKSMWYMAVYSLSFCVWCPVMCCCYIFSELFWQCLK